MGGKSLIPLGKAEYDRFFGNIVQYTEMMCAGESPRWTHIPPGERTLLSGAFVDWHTAYLRTLVPHIKADTEAMKAAFNRSKNVLSRFIHVWFRGFPDIVTADHLANVDIAPIDHTRTPGGKPSTRPVFHIRVKDTRLLAIDFKDEAGAGKARPKGMNGALISLAIRDEPPVSPEELTDRRMLATHRPFPITFREEDRGKTVYIAMQWQSSGGVLGDFTEIQSTIVP
ncbi:MAG: hypothetical protein LBF78_03705 [Treponema sp.]|jgi:hypothetical protein|nr:hypothetical protein [Treponema sp.]